MAARTLRGGFMGVALLGGPLLALGVLWAGPALADETTYLKDLHNDGIQALSGNDQVLLQLGRNMCDELSRGTPAEQLEDVVLQQSDTEQGARGLSPKQANDIVFYAMVDLCPNPAPTA